MQLVLKEAALSKWQPINKRQFILLRDGEEILNNFKIINNADGERNLENFRHKTLQP